MDNRSGASFRLIMGVGTVVCSVAKEKSMAKFTKIASDKMTAGPLLNTMEWLLLLGFDKTWLARCLWIKAFLTSEEGNTDSTATVLANIRIMAMVQYRIL